VGPKFDEVCSSVAAPTSPIQLASYFAGLTAVLCGLTLGALAFILGKKEAAPPPTITLFTFSLLVLGFDAFIFALLSARRPSMGGLMPGEEYLCYLAGARLLPAIGMLIVGATSLLAGIGWMVAQYAKVNDIESSSFASLCGVLISIIGIGTSFYLVAACTEYLNFVNFPGPSSTAGKAGILIFGATMAITSSGIIWTRTVGLCRYLKHNRNWDNLIEPRYKAIALAAISTAIYGLICTIYTGVISTIRSSETLRSTGLVWSTIGLCLVPPLVIFFVIGYAVPGTKIQDAWKRYGEQPSTDREKSAGP